MAGIVADGLSEQVLHQFLKDADAHFLTEVEVAQSSKEWTSVADQDEYVLPMNFARARMVTFDGHQLREIGWNEYQDVTADGQSTSAVGRPCYFMILDRHLKLVNPPADADYTIKMYYQRRAVVEKRDLSGSVGAGPTTTVVPIAAIAAGLGGQVDGGSETSSYFDGCVLEVTRGSTIYRSTITNYDETNLTVTVSPALGATPVEADACRIYDVLEMPAQWALAAIYFAVARILESSSVPANQSRAQKWDMQWEQLLAKAKTKARSRSRGARMTRW